MYNILEARVRHFKNRESGMAKTQVDFLQYLTWNLSTAIKNLSPMSPKSPDPIIHHGKQSQEMLKIKELYIDL